MAPLIELYKTDHTQLVTWVAKTYGIGQHSVSNPHRQRRETIARRLRLYRDQATVDVERIIDAIYETDDYKLTLRRYVAVALEQNVTRRIVNEVASLYDRPAVRTVTDRPDQFRAEEKRLRMHFVHQEAHRLTNLCNEVLIWRFQGVDGNKALRIVTPDTFDAIPHPSDQLVPAGYLLDMPPTTVLDGAARSNLPHYEIWDDTYRYLINAHGNLVDESGTMATKPTEHRQGRIPGVLFHRREPTTCILDASAGSDIESCHLGVALLNVMIMRLSKSQGERQPILRGNLAQMASGQVMNGERPLVLPPEVVAEMLESKTDPDHYLTVKRDKIGSLAQTWGMSYEQFVFQETADTSSGKAYSVRRERLTEIRIEQRGRAVEHEGAVAELVGFKSEGLHVDFQEQAIPLDATEEVDLLDKKMRKGLDSPVSYLMRKDPDLDRAGAIKLMKSNLRDFAGLVQWVRALNVPADADAEDAGKSPEENGADNDKKSDEDEDEDENDTDEDAGDEDDAAA
jgi:hypothetical protein